MSDIVTISRYILTVYIFEVRQLHCLLFQLNSVIVLLLGSNMLITGGLQQADSEAERGHE